LGFLHKKEVVL